MENKREYGVYKPARNETYEATYWNIVGDELDNFDDAHARTFYCRIADRIERQKFMITSGLSSDKAGIYLVATRLPDDIKLNARVRFLGKDMLVEAIGFIIDNSRLNNANKFSNDAIKSRFVKGIKIV